MVRLKPPTSKCKSRSARCPHRRFVFQSPNIPAESTNLPPERTIDTYRRPSPGASRSRRPDFASPLGQHPCTSRPHGNRQPQLGGSRKGRLPRYSQPTPAGADRDTPGNPVDSSPRAGRRAHAPAVAQARPADSGTPTNDRRRDCAATLARARPPRRMGAGIRVHLQSALLPRCPFPGFRAIDPSRSRPRTGRRGHLVYKGWMGRDPSSRSCHAMSPG